MAAGLAAQPRGILAKAIPPVEDGIPKSILKLLPDKKHPGYSWINEGGLDDHAEWLFTSHNPKFDAMIEDPKVDWKKWIRPDSPDYTPGRRYEDGEVDPINVVYDHYLKLLDGDVASYKTLRDIGYKDSQIKAMLREQKDEMDFWAKEVVPYDSDEKAIAEIDKILDKGRPSTPPISSLANIAGYLSRTGYTHGPHQPTPGPQPVTREYLGSDVSGPLVRLPAPSRANPPLEMRLDDLKDLEKVPR